MNPSLNIEVVEVVVGDVHTEVGVFHGLARGEALLVVIAQQLVQVVQCFWAHQMLILAVHKPLPALSAVSSRKRASNVTIPIIKMCMAEIWNKM